VPVVLEEAVEEEEEGTAAMAVVCNRSVRTIGGIECPSGPVAMITKGGALAASSSVFTGGWPFAAVLVAADLPLPSVGVPGRLRLPRGEGGETMM